MQKDYSRAHSQNTEQTVFQELPLLGRTFLAEVLCITEFFPPDVIHCVKPSFQHAAGLRFCQTQ